MCTCHEGDRRGVLLARAIRSPAGSGEEQKKQPCRMVNCECCETRVCAIERWAGLVASSRSRRKEKGAGKNSQSIVQVPWVSAPILYTACVAIAPYRYGALTSHVFPVFDGARRHADVECGNSQREDAHALAAFLCPLENGLFSSDASHKFSVTAGRIAAVLAEAFGMNKRAREKKRQDQEWLDSLFHSLFLRKM